MATIGFSAPVRPAPAPSLQMYLYRRPLHSDLFQIKARRQIRHNAYDLEAWVMPGGHVIRFRHADFSCCELLVDHADRLPLDGAVTCLPCTGEQDFDHSFGPEKVRYLTSLQTETLTDSLYKTSYQELIELAKDTDALYHTFTDELGRLNASILDVQRLGREVHAQSYHLIAQSGLVVRTQTIFEHR